MVPDIVCTRPPHTEYYIYIYIYGVCVYIVCYCECSIYDIYLATWRMRTALWYIYIYTLYISANDIYMDITTIVCILDRD